MHFSNFIVFYFSTTINYEINSFLTNGGRLYNLFYIIIHVVRGTNSFFYLKTR